MAPDPCALPLEAFPYGVVLAGEDGTMLALNARASATFGYPAGELVGRPISWLLPRPTFAECDDRRVGFWDDFERRTPVTERTAGRRKDGVMVPLEIMLNPVTGGGRRDVLVTIIDITARVDEEARLAAAATQDLVFTRLVADLSARCGIVDPDGVDGAVADGLQQIGQALQLDWAVRWRLDADGVTAVPTHHWVRPSCPAPGPFSMAPIPNVMARLSVGEACCVTNVDDLPDAGDRELFERLGVRSGAVVPLTPSDGEPGLSGLALGSITREHEWTPAIIERLRLVAGVVSQAAARKASHRALQKALDEVRQLHERVVSENVEYRREVKRLRMSRPIVSESAAIRQVLSLVEQVAPTPATVLLLGETGVGKDVLAQAIHDLSPRRQRPMIRVSCAAIPASLIESELFGHEKGAYTGALSRQMGRFEAAHQSTLFLDEIGDLPPETQVKLLRVLQERVVERLGSTQATRVDVRIIAATNRNLEEAVREKLFREDLFYRLNVFPIVVPPLRDRPEDVPALVSSFIDEFSTLFGKPIDSISGDSLRELQRYPWPGNVRELRNIIERAVIVATGRELVVPTPPLGQRPLPQAAMTLHALEVEHIRTVLASTGWRVRGRGGAAERLGLKPTTLESRMARLGITRARAC